jgi:hypothetical protein
MSNEEKLDSDVNVHMTRMEEIALSKVKTDGTWTQTPTVAHNLRMTS